jgi:hypothetical protein
VSQDPLLPFYNRARDRLRQCDPRSFIELAIDVLHSVYISDINALRTYQPWNLLLAIKWALQEADAESCERRAATMNDLHEVLHVLHEMEAYVRMPSSYEHASLFMRHLAFQQFWLQRGASGDALVRQDLIFSSLTDNHPFSRDFRQATGIRPVESIDLSFALLATLLKDPSPRIINRQWFRTIEGSLSPDVVDRFFSGLSKTIAEFHVWLSNATQKNIPIADQRILPTPLLEFPLIRNDPDTYTVLFPTLAMRSMETIIYRTL